MQCKGIRTLDKNIYQMWLHSCISSVFILVTFNVVWLPKWVGNICEKCQPLIAMQCMMWHTQVSSGAISTTTDDSCDFPYHYQGVSFDKWAAGWSKIVLWSAGTVRRWCLFTPVWHSSATANKLCPATRHEDSSPWRRPRSLRYVTLFLRLLLRWAWFMQTCRRVLLNMFNMVTSFMAPHWMLWK